MKGIRIALLGGCISLLAGCSGITLPEYQKPAIERNSDVQPKQLANCIINGWKGPYPAANLTESDADYYFGGIPGPDAPKAKISVTPRSLDSNAGSRVTLRVAQGTSADIVTIVEQCMR
ncbi:hypothetical protein ACVFVO_16840 [Advenella kashmirensis]